MAEILFQIFFHDREDYSIKRAKIKELLEQLSNDSNDKMLPAMLWTQVYCLLANLIFFICRSG